MKKLILSLFIITLTISINAQVLQAGIGGSLGLASPLEYRLSLDLSYSFINLELFSSSNDFYIFTLNTGILSDPLSFLPPDFYMDLVFWFGVGFGGGFEYDSSELEFVPYALMTQIIPLFLSEGLEDIPLIPVVLFKVAFPKNSVRCDLMLRLKWVFLFDN